MKWVKASERMPEVGKIKFMKAKGWGMFIGVNSINDGKIHESSSLNPLEYNYELIEWLDEIESTPPVPAMEDGWVKVEDRLPEVHPIAKYSFRVLCLTNTGKMEVGYLSDNLWYRDNGHYFSGHGYTITHWRPLPPPPSNQ